MPKVALSGASGNIGQVLRPSAARAQHQPAPLWTRDAAAAGRGKYARRPQPNLAVVDRLLEGVDVLIHMAGTSVERPLKGIIQNNLVGLHSVYEGAQRHSIKRVVFASSNPTIGMYSVDEKLKPDCAFQPQQAFTASARSGARR